MENRKPKTEDRKPICVLRSESWPARCAAASSLAPSTPPFAPRRRWCAKPCSASSATPCPDRPFFDVFAGTGVVGLEALSRGASAVTFVERDFRLIADLERHIASLRRRRTARIVAHRCLPLDRALAGAERTRQRLSESSFRGLRAPPRRLAERDRHDCKSKVPARFGDRASIGKRVRTLDELPGRTEWDERRYGRNHAANLGQGMNATAPEP